MHDRHINPLIYGLIWSILFTVTVTAEKNYGYMLTPLYIFPGSEYVVTVDLNNFLEIVGQGQYDVTSTIKRYNSDSRTYDDIVSKTEVISKGDPIRDITLQIPDDIDTTSNYRAEINVASNGLLLADDIAYVNVFRETTDSILIQTDKGLYKAGQTVQFRVMTVNHERKVEVNTMTIDIFDGDGNRVRRWANVSDNSGVFVGKMEMSQYPVLGTWSIKVTATGNEAKQSFQVKEFELPKFDVTLNLPDVVSDSDIYLEGTVTSLYTFGKGVTGSVDLLLTSETSGKFSKMYKLTDGEAKIKLEITDIYYAFDLSPGSPTSSSTSFSSWWSTTSVPASRRQSLTIKNKKRTATATATVIEDITGNTREVSMRIILVEHNVGFKLDKSKGLYFKPGQSVDIAGKITNFIGSTFDGLAAEKYSIKIGVSYRTTSRYTYVKLVAERDMDVDSKNQFYYQIDENLITDEMSAIRTEILLFAKREQVLLQRETVTFTKIKSINGYLMSIEQLSGSASLNIGDTANYRISLIGEGTITASYKVTSKGLVVKSGPRFSLSENQPYEFSLRCTAEMVPSLVIVAWSVLPLDRLTSRTYDYAISASIGTKVKPQQIQETTIEFQQESVQPGDSARINLKSKSRSTFYILAVDRSILLLDKGNDITEAILPDLYKSPIADSSGGGSTYWTFASGGLTMKYFRIKDPYSTSTSSSTDYYYYYDYFSSSSYAASYAATSMSSSSSPVYESVAEARTTRSFVSTLSTTTPEIDEQKQETIRKEFPDTWLFMNVSADFSGSASVVQKVPDTITTWVANCFAVGPQSMISTAVRKTELKVFMPFFISLQLPFSVIRNEQLVLQANIFNYHTEDLYVMVTLKKSSSFRGLTVVKRGKGRVLEEKCGNIVICVFAKAGRATAAFFPIVPTAIGKIKITIIADSSKFKDTVIKYLRVESEGAPRDIAYPILIDLSHGTAFETHMDLNYPPNTVEGSQRMKISLIGDIMGPTIEGLDRLVKMPYGCGEQNMISTAPSIFVYKYLKAAGKLTEELKAKAENYMRIGMQRQLRYRHSDWSFSAWGGSGSGSTWLTAFVLKVFAMASHYVDINDQIVTMSAKWLISIQNPDGSFPEKGHVGSRSLQGGASGTAERMTAYVLIALKEGKRASSNVQFCDDCLDRLDKSIKDASNFLANNLENQTSVYTVAISAYALTITDHNGAWRARNMLDDLSKGGTGQMYWEEPNQPTTSIFHFGRNTLAASIEMTAYGLLAFVESGSTIKGLLIQKWLIAQRNPYGGFISTQDTVIGLQALSEMAASVNSARDMTIKLSYTDIRPRVKTFRITENNAMVVQMADLSTDTSKISIHAWGKKGSTAIFTVSLFYNINMDLEARSLKLNVTVLKETINGFTLRSCVRWLEDEISGMIVVEVGIPSGFEANRWSISEHKLLKRTEIEDRNVILYYDEVTYADICTDISVVRDKMVAQIKPVPCKAYEYYEPSNQVTVFYEPLSAKNSNICNICGIECGCNVTGEKLWFPQKWCKQKMKG